MLILTRRVGETVVIGNDVDVTVLGVKGNQVRLGVKAPREVSVHREEIYKRIKDEKREDENKQSARSGRKSNRHGSRHNAHNGGHAGGSTHHGHHAADNG